MKNRLCLVVSVFFALIVILVYFYLTNTPYIHQKALNVSEKFIELMWHGSYKKAYELASTSRGDWNNIEEFQTTWIEIFSEKYRRNRTYHFFSNDRYKSGRTYPYQSLGNYYKRWLLKQKPLHPQIFEIQYYIDARQKDESFPNHIHSLRLKWQLEDDKWKLLRFRITAW